MCDVAQTCIENRACEAGSLQSEGTAAYVPESSEPLQKKGVVPSLPTVGGASDVWRVLRSMEALDREHFVVLHLDVRNRILRQETVAIDTLRGVEVHPREVFKNAIVGSAASQIFAHNHPSGDPNPSKEDVQLTGRLSEVETRLGTKALGHVILARDRFVSMAERSQMNG